MIDMTVLLATYNGEKVLGRTLEGYVQLDAGMDDWKIIVVDNASTDSTPQIIDSFKDRLPITRVIATQAGKNHALNAGLAEIEGDIIIVTDDDAIPQIGFLSAWRRAIRGMPEFDVFGGAIDLQFDVSPPDWMLDGEHKFEELYAQRKNIHQGAIKPENIFGPNMAVRRKVFDDGFRYNSSIGPNNNDTSYGMGSESEFCTRAYRSGYATAFAAEPHVHHIVRANQMSPKYWSERAYRLGRGVATRHWLSGEMHLKSRPAAVQFAADAWRKIQRFGLSLVTLTPNKVGKFNAFWEYKFFCGYHDEHKSRQTQARRDLSAH